MMKEDTRLASTSEPHQQIVDDFVKASHGNLATVKALLARYPSLVTATALWKETAIGAAGHTGQREIAEFLLAHGAPADICTVAMLGRTDGVAGFLQADPRLAHATGAHGLPVLFHAAIGGHTAVAELLLASGTDVNAGEGENMALHGAVRFGQAAMVEWLLNHGAHVNALDHEQKTPLRVAVETGHTAVAEVLRRRGGRE